MISIKNEIMPLKKVMLHRPGNELLNITPNNLKNYLYEDIPYLKVAREEHDEFARILKNNDIEIFYLEDLMTEVLDIYPELKEKFIKQYVFESNLKINKYKSTIINYLNEFNNNDLVLKTMEGININELSSLERDINHSLVDNIVKCSLFLIEPMPNLMYIRDLFTVIGNNIVLNKLNSKNRCRENIYLEYIFKYHPDYKNINLYYNRYNIDTIEGGDIINLNDKTLGLGLSERTSSEAIEKLSTEIFENSENEIDTILVFKIPENRDTIHLDTVLTQVDYDKFLYQPKIIDSLKIYEITKDVIDGIKVHELMDSLENILEKYLNCDLTMIPCGGGDKIISEREQWNAAVSILCISPGIVITYERNNITNAVLRRYGIKVIEIKSSELSRGRGGTRCLTGQLYRK